MKTFSFGVVNVRAKMNKTAASVLTAAIAAAILLLKPFGLDFKQAAVLAAIAAVIICWTLELCNKTLASAALVAALLLLNCAPPEKLLSFPLSATFPMILLCYLFSRGISNSGIAKLLLDPLLSKYAGTPLRVLLLMILTLALTIRVIPQPLIRLIMLSEIFSSFLRRTDAQEDTRQILLFSLYEFYIIVNAGALNADIILNTSAVSFAGLDMSASAWLTYMLPPTAAYCALALGVICLMFRRRLIGVKISPLPQGDSGGPAPLSRRQLQLLITVLVTIALWITKPLHGVSENIISLASVAVMAALGWLAPKDIDSIDVSTLVFLTAANAIGGAMTGSGAAQKLLSGLGAAFPEEFSVRYVLTLILVSMALHFLLGSNTTALSVAIPGLALVCGDTVPLEVLTLTAYMSLIPHHLLPFHCVGMAIGVGNGCFKADLIFKVGLVMMALIFVAILGIYMPWWRIIGLL